jgi:hypothetical protein
MANHIDFIHFIRLWNILWNGDFKDKISILFLAHVEGLLEIMRWRFF